MWMIASLPFWVIAFCAMVISLLCIRACFSPSTVARNLRREYSPEVMIVAALVFMIAAGFMAVIAAKVAS